MIIFNKLFYFKKNKYDACQCSDHIIFTNSFIKKIWWLTAYVISSISIVSLNECMFHSSIIYCTVDSYCSFHISSSKAFLRLLFYNFLFLTETFMMCVNVFYITRNTNSAWSDKRQRFSQIYLNYNKIAHFCNVVSIDMT